MRWRFQHGRGWKILRPGLILLVIFTAKKPTAPPPYRQSIPELFILFLSGQFSNTAAPYLPASHY